MTVATPLRRDVTFYQDFTGRTASVQRAEVRARLLQERSAGPALLVEQRAQQVHGFDVVVVTPECQGLGVRQGQLKKNDFNS